MWIIMIGLYLSVELRVKVDVRILKSCAFLSEIPAQPVDVNGAGLTTKMTALHQACKHGKVASVYFLMDNGTDTSLQDAAGKIPRAHALENSHNEVVCILDDYQAGISTSQLAKKALEQSQKVTSAAIPNLNNFKAVETLIQAVENKVSADIIFI